MVVEKKRLRVYILLMNRGDYAVKIFGQSWQECMECEHLGKHRCYFPHHVHGVTYICVGWCLLIQPEVVSSHFIQYTRGLPIPMILQ